MFRSVSQSKVTPDSARRDRRRSFTLLLMGILALAVTSAASLTSPIAGRWSNRRFGFHLLLLVVLALTLVPIGASSVGHVAAATASGGPAGLASTSPASSPTGTPEVQGHPASGWQTFAYTGNALYAYSLKYPPQWTVMPGQDSLADFGFVYFRSLGKSSIQAWMTLLSLHGAGYQGLVREASAELKPETLQSVTDAQSGEITAVWGTLKESVPPFEVGDMQITSFFHKGDQVYLVVLTQAPCENVTGVYQAVIDSFTPANWHPAKHKPVEPAAPTISQNCSPPKSPNYPPWGTLLVAGSDWGNGVNVYSSGCNGCGYGVEGTYGLMYQCVELSQRFYAQKFGGPNRWPVRSAYQMWSNHPSTLTPIPNGGSQPPQWGDIMVWNASVGGGAGHTAVVTGASGGQVNWVEQNADPTGRRSATINNNNYVASSGLIGWLHDPRQGPPPTFDPYAFSSSVSMNLNSTLEVVMRGADGGVYHNWQLTPRGGWSGWNLLGGPFQRDPVITRNDNGTLEVFVVGNDNALYHRWQLTPSGGWSDWNTLGGSWPGQPSVSINLNGTLEVFMRGTNGGIYHNWQLTPRGAWSGWSLLGAPFPRDPVITRNNNGTLEVFVVGNDNALYHRWQLTPSGGWSDWNTLGVYSGGSWPGQPSVSMNLNGTLEVFMRGADGGVYHIVQLTPRGAWSNWGLLGGPFQRDPVVTRNDNGTLEVFVVGNDNALYHRWQLTPSGGWSDWNTLGGSLAREAAVGRNDNGTIEVFAVFADSTLYHIVQLTPRGAWSGWGSLGGSWPPPPTATPLPPGPTDTPLPVLTNTPALTNTPGGPTNTPGTGDPFTDLNGNIFRPAIDDLYNYGVVNGTDPTHYSPALTSTRAQFAKVVVLAFGLTPYTPTSGQDFTDVPPGYFAYTYIETGYAAGILGGFDANGCAAHNAAYPCYLPNLQITRGQVTKLVVAAAYYPFYTPSSGQTFSDVPPSNVFFVSIETAHNKGVINGYNDNTFRPNNSVRRDEMAQIVYKGVTTP